MRNQRGFVEIALLTAVIFVGLLGFTVGASGVRKWIPGFGGSDNKTKQVSVTKSESKPIIVKGPDGKEMFLYSTKTETSNMELSEEQKLTLWQKLMVLPKLWLLFMVLGLFFPPIAVFMGIVNGRLKIAAKQIVAGVENGLSQTAPEAKKVVLDELSKKMDGSAKALVAKLKREI